MLFSTAYYSYAFSSIKDCTLISREKDQDINGLTNIEYGILKLHCLKLEEIHSEIFLFTRNTRMSFIFSENRAGLQVISR
ncbi:1522_t:CDS:2 [Dentiscutata heterogama]|uniref:1522_t:CDS:1 n=1 Tax=Dentiscutata heterogama TaxID=1316150 RepID=A0ACA9M0C5_9GLOM|nr:1522_t:CDS:2 [Dentiscutata heterogama]